MSYLPNGNFSKTDEIRKSVDAERKTIEHFAVYNFNAPNTASNNWNDMNQQCANVGQRLCKSTEICPTVGGNPNDPNFDPIFNGNDNWIAVSDAPNEWLTLAKNERRCRTHGAQFGPPGWGTNNEASGWYRAAKCCPLVQPNSLTNSWTHVPNSGAVKGVTQLHDGTIVGVGMDNLLYTRATLTSPWVQVPNSGAVMRVTQMMDGTIVGVGMDNTLWTRATLTSGWIQIPNSGAVMDIIQLRDGSVVGIGMDNFLWVRSTLTGGWTQVPGSGSVKGITSLSNGTILGVGMDNLLYTRATINAGWVQVPNSGSVIAVEALADGKILGVGTDNQLYYK